MQGNESQLDWWFEGQMLHQETDMDCGLCVFGALAGLDRDEILAHMPDASSGKTLGEWDSYLQAKGLKLIRFRPGEEHPLPCAHLHEIVPGYYHWIYQATDGGIHDPSPTWTYYPPKLVKLSFYDVVLTVALERSPETTELNTEISEGL